MAVLTEAQKVEIIRAVAASRQGVHYTRPVGSLAIQAIEDWFEANRVNLVTAIDAATAPVVIPPAEKLAMAKFWLRQKFERGG